MDASVPSERRAVSFLKSAGWWGLIAVVPLVALVTFSNVWTVGTTACDPDFGHYAGDNFAYLGILFLGLPAAYMIEGLALFLGWSHSRSRAERLILATGSLGTVVVVALAVTVPNVLLGSSAC